MQELTLDLLKYEARIFCETQSEVNHKELIGITDGKAVGTHIEHLFKKYLEMKYFFEIGNSANGVDLPGKNINTDIKVTSIRQPQSSCPFKSSKQKIFGLGYNLLIFVYDKADSVDSCYLNFTHLTFIDKERTSDYTTTKILIEMLKNDANKEDIISFLIDKNIPGDEITYNNIADEIIENSVKQGYITISNALQWRLQYSRVINLNNQIEGVFNFEKK